MTESFYRPEKIEFQVAHDGSNMPECLGEFKTPEEMAKFIQGNLTAVNWPLMVNRFMDQKEKADLRAKQTDTMENMVPHFESKLHDADVALADAKKNQKDAEERYNSIIADCKEMSAKAKRGTIEMNLDEKFTFRVPYMKKYYFYSWVDGKLKLCKISHIPDSEKQDLFNAMSENEDWIDDNYGKKTKEKDVR